MTLSALKKEIDQLGVTEAKLYLYNLHQALEGSKPGKDTDELIAKTRNLVASMNAVLTCKDNTQLNDLLAQLDKDYQTLYVLSEVGHFSKKVKRALLQVLGFTCALLVSIPLGIFSMVACTIFLDPHNLDTFRELPNYFFTGILVGVGIVLQFFNAFENRRDRQLNFSLTEIKTSFESLIDDVDNDQLATIRQAVLKDLVGEDAAAQKQFLNSMQTYDMMGFKAQFLTSNLKGYQGHHTALVFVKNNEQTTIELGSPSLVEIKSPDQVYHRQCTGETLVSMISMDILLKKHYESFSRTVTYRPYDKDCHSYIDVILASVGEDLNPVERATKDDAWVGQTICSTLQRNGIFRDKPSIKTPRSAPEVSDELDDESPSPDSPSSNI